ncbi:hypothetical protein GQ600_3945 [Phytophthora cactorum]|nr:hypothetical protein GQ600_3945 [Phytophthora cactorum]
MHTNRIMQRTHLFATDTFAYSLSSNHNPGYQMNCQSGRAIPPSAPYDGQVRLYKSYTETDTLIYKDAYKSYYATDTFAYSVHATCHDCPPAADPMIDQIEVVVQS